MAPSRVPADLSAGLADPASRSASPGFAASLLIVRDGEPLREERVNASERSLFCAFSAGKPITAVAVHLLAERGALSLDDPISRHWPGYAVHGKQTVTIRDVLTHRSPAPNSTGSVLGDLRIVADWGASVGAAERARPLARRWTAERPWYHALSFGFLLGEVVERVAGEPLTSFVSRELFAPLGMRDSFLRLPRERADDAVELISRGPLERIRRNVFNRTEVRAALAPAASLHTTARDLARFYAMLLRGGRNAEGERVLRPETVLATRALAHDRRFDRGMLYRARWGTGFELGFPGRGLAFGDRTSTAAFGHNGSNICLAWADPGEDLVFVYLSNLAEKRLRARRYLSGLSDAARDLTSGAARTAPG
ncbi:beta-lactamase family protein [Leucobacter weissii]|uniref:Beta-lactamase family protein n=1 Tax=Leucobacter weissii TaxID=1983706 RepID=A0A939SBU0_9MICO|nr:serine hydrolase domain-containing protein [Leucobacter weissii]MBO1901780.1 beta-lactamase family protein [Leucobacter weissii]